MNSPDDTEEEDEAARENPRAAKRRPSRTEKTRAATEVNRLGLELTRLKPAELDLLELPERLREEVDRSQGLKPKSRGRQNRLIGQILRAEDHEEIADRLESLNKVRRDGVHYEKVTERWRDRLVEEGDPAVEALIAEYPDADRQRLRQLTRNARKDPEANNTKRARRELIRAIRELRA